MDPYPLDQFSSSEAEDNESLSSDDELINRMKTSRHSNDVEIDEFEKEMNDELEQVICSYEKASGAMSVDTSNLPNSNNGNGSSSKLVQTEEEAQSTEQESTTETESGQTDGLYDESYFSSGSEDDVDKVGGEKSKSDSRRRVLTNDELFYDPDLDDEDEKWMNKQRQHYRQVQHHKAAICNHETSERQEPRHKKKKVESVPGSDAILACPACMTTLCIDCQRHDLYKMQFRAMFVINCSISRNELLRYEESKTKGKKNTNKQKGNGKLVEATQSVGTGMSDVYHPVKCAECGTEVAVLDKEEIYHFFNVVESLA